MFKKRAPNRKKQDDDDDDGATSPTITVSVPQEAFGPASPTSLPHPSRRASEDTDVRSQTDSRRSSIEQRHVQPHQPWKPWDPQKLAMNDIREILTPQSGSGIPTPSLSSSPSSTTSTASTSKKSPSMMLNLTSMFSGTNGNTSAQGNSNGSAVGFANGSSRQQQQQQQQPVEAQLWNADITATSPLSPAGPRYISAIAGSGAGSGGGSGPGRLTSGWGIGGAAARRSNDGSTWRSFGQASSAPSPETPRQPSFSRSSSSSSFAASPTMTSSQGYRYSEKPQFKSAASSRPQQAGYIPNSDDSPDAHSSNKHNLPSTIPSMSSPTLNMSYSSTNTPGRLYDGARKKNGRGVAENVRGAPGMSWADGRDPLEYTNESSHSHRDEDLQDRKSDRNRTQPHHSDHDTRYPLSSSDPKRVLRARLFCLRQNRRLHPCVRLIVVLFLAGSVCFTSFHLLFRDSNSKNRLRKSFEYTEQQLKIRKILGPSGTRKRAVSAFDVEAQNYSMHQWALDTYDINNSNAIAHVGEDYMLSKAFSGAMQPTRVIPFYFKASFTDEDDDDSHEYYDDGWQGSPDGVRSGSNSAPTEHSPVKLDPSIVTITTLITPDRYGVFLKLVRQYRGPISVATHIRKGEDQDAMFHELNAFFQEHAVLRRYVDLHVIVDGVDFQLNMWRNVARMFARTDYFMMLDVDFHIPSGLKSHLHHDPRIQELMSSGAAIVIPAFEYALNHDPKDSKYFPDTKTDLISLLEKKHVRVFHDSFPPGHAATDTPRWIKMNKSAFDTDQRLWGSVPKGRVEDDVGQISEEERVEYLEQEAEGERPYKVTRFEPKYEPYIVLKREGTPWCDERFVGYGANKAACLFEIYISGIDFWVMPQDFLIHQYHDYPTTNRKNGRIINKQLFMQFQQEICFATLRRMIDTGEWYTAKANNLRHQCGAFENFLKSADQLAQDYEERHPDSLLEEPVFVANVDEQKRRKSLREALVLAGQGKDGRSGSDGDRYESQGHNKVGLGKQIVDDEEHQDPFMNRPKGKVWGGIQPRTYYVPPPLDPEDDIPTGGIDIDKAVDATTKDDTAMDGYRETGEYDKARDNDLTDAKLEQFRQGIILPDGHDRDRFAFRKEGWDSQKDGLHGDRSDNRGDRGHGGDEDGARVDDRYTEEDSDDQEQSEDFDAARKSYHPPAVAAGRLSEHGQKHGGGSFVEAAEQLEERLRQLGAAA